MQTDLTSKFEIALTRAAEWSEARVQSFVDELARGVRGGTVDWDAGAGEQWARVLQDGQRVALVWRRGPFLFVDHRCQELAKEIPEVASMVVEHVHDWKTRTYSIQADQAHMLFGMQATSDAVDLAQLSVDELWWATV